ncbi:DUF805 domain-containing protein [Paenibacillus macquariensis]|uniref:Uncharacterized membrane protein YhaH, DUF805 family n=1 Tax=Paenibacillus macquariensis TaxID=948756 RepID=A0ABY1JYX0_9BACL|nr:DUF805 domain-containing protein [Paenibacillus macquariensis]MEC0091209.1 DUF805 domain-containing protein [Paenibacillus macquariensis]OAB29241.1 hypothetical protein PMSM_23945 [Paenibacillus macquariensis subsp. macquariensis]SIR01760.1 Uncharacterized membrane protein YhaH, DUF805 family [Paenibacillus macquariensis]
MVWYLKGLKNYIGFKGRASRKEYWMFMLVYSIVLILFSILESIANMPPVLSVLYYLSTFLPCLAVAARRLHDTGRSGWWNLIPLIPVIGDIIFIIFACQDSQENDNQYGPNPKI